MPNPLTIYGPGADLDSLWQALRASRPAAWIPEEPSQAFLSGVGVERDEVLMARSPRVGERTYHVTVVRTPIQIALVSVIPAERRYVQPLERTEVHAVALAWRDEWAAASIDAHPSLQVRLGG